MKKAIAVLLSAHLSVFAAFGVAGSREMPPLTLAGTFDGTWTYLDKSYKIAIFMSHDKNGQLTMRYHVRAASGYEYETDAGGYGRYLNEGTPVDVIFSGGTDRGESVYDGKFERTTMGEDRTSVESADFKMYRGYDGRTLVLHYPNYKTETFDAQGRLKSTSQTDSMLIFNKLSDIVLDFKEIPY